MDTQILSLSDNRKTRRKLQHDAGFKSKIRIVKSQPRNDGPITLRPCGRCWIEGRGIIPIGLHPPDEPWNCPDGVIIVNGQRYGIMNVKPRPFRRSHAFQIR